MKQNTSKDKFGDQKYFEGIELKVASPERIVEWSHGEVTKPETMNYRTQRSEKNGLFDEKIFGPEKDFECYCGKYRGIRYKGIICEKCGVELTRSIVRRERMGHIELATPVAHIWFLRSLPSRIGTILGMSTGDLEKVVYFAGYLVTKVSEDEQKRVIKDLENEYKNKLRTLNDEKTKDAVNELYTNTKRDIESLVIGRVLDEVEYHKFSLKFGSIFEAEIGAEAVYNLFKKLDLQKLYDALEKELETVGSTDREKLIRRLSMIRGMMTSNIRPEWMFLTKIPVIPPALRPMVALEGGRTATSDINDLYRRVINRNNRLRKLKEIFAPDVILRNEKRILQEAVDALIDNSIRHGNALFAGVNQAQRRPLKSLADNLKGKKGLLRGNLLGKRVDYSARSVIVVGPDMKLDQCGLPKHMALELFRPFVIADLLKKELAFNIRGASRLIDDGIPEVWAILEDVIKDKYVLLNRAPTLHRLGIQAFKPQLIEGNAIQLHPLVCNAYNADFDGDTMAVHLPLSVEAQAEAREIMASDKNILKPGSGDLISAPSKEIILGAFWMTKDVDGQKGEGNYYESIQAVHTAIDYGALGYRAKIKVLPPNLPKFKEFFIDGVPQFIETTPGRLLFNEVLPDDYPFVNKVIPTGVMRDILDDLIATKGVEQMPKILDAIKDFGFKFSTISGTTFGLDEVRVPAGKGAVIVKARKEAEVVSDQFNDGLITEDERLRKNIEIWHEAKSVIQKMVPESLDKNGSAYDLSTSGARGSIGQLTQMAGMKGLIQNSQGQTLEVPIISSGLEGFTPIEYFISTHGARKGMTDTALNTANAGYLTRKLFVVAQDVVITEHDCGTKEGMPVTRKTASGIEQPLSKHIFGRVLAEDIVNKAGEVLFKRNHLLTKVEAKMVDAADDKGIAQVVVRSPLTCKTHNGICTMCYGLDLGKNRLIDLGEAAGTVAAQAIGEPGTQLTMRTFHTGGAATVGGDITAGLPRVVEVFEKRRPKNPGAVAKCDGLISEIRNTGKEKVIVITPDAGEAQVKKLSTSKKIGTRAGKSETEHPVALVRVPLVKIGQHVSKGDIITDGSLDPDDVFHYAGKEKAEQYIISEIKKLYELQGEGVSQKHIEVIVRQMFTRVRIKESGDSNFSVGDVVEIFEVNAENKKLRADNLIEAKVEQVPMGITEVSLSRKSFLSAASFQNTTKILISSAVRGSTDELRGLMENVIVGRLIPAGTGFPGSEKAAMVEKVSRESGALRIETEGDWQGR